VDLADSVSTKVLTEAAARIVYYHSLTTIANNRPTAGQDS